MSLVTESNHITLGDTAILYILPMNEPCKRAAVMSSQPQIASWMRLISVREGKSQSLMPSL